MRAELLKTFWRQSQGDIESSTLWVLGREDRWQYVIFMTFLAIDLHDACMPSHLHNVGSQVPISVWHRVAAGGELFEV